MRAQEGPQEALVAGEVGTAPGQIAPGELQLFESERQRQEKRGGLGARAALEGVEERPERNRRLGQRVFERGLEVGGGARAERGRPRLGGRVGREVRGREPRDALRGAAEVERVQVARKEANVLEVCVSPPMEFPG